VVAVVVAPVEAPPDLVAVDTEDVEEPAYDPASPADVPHAVNSRPKSKVNKRRHSPH